MAVSFPHQRIAVEIKKTAKRGVFTVRVDSLMGLPLAHGTEEQVSICNKQQLQSRFEKWTFIFIDLRFL
jgi:hypothetical protein